jgi:hypothetical protein
MKYPDGGGLTAAGRARREQVRLAAVQLFGRARRRLVVGWRCSGILSWPAVGGVIRVSG